MVAACLCIPPASFSLPAGQVSCELGANVEWLLTKASATQLLPMLALANTGDGMAEKLAVTGLEASPADSFGQYLLPYAGGVVAALMLASVAFAYLVLR